MRNSRPRTCDAIAHAALFVGTMMTSALLAASTAAQTNREAREGEFRERVQPLIAKYCADCHTGEEAEGGLSFDTSRLPGRFWSAEGRGSA